MLRPFDYILDKDDNFWVVSHYQGGKLYGKLVYSPDKTGNRYNHFTKKMYTKKYNSLSIIPSQYQKKYQPKKCFFKNKEKLTGVWKEYVIALNKSGIDDESIGIFGSYLIGFDTVKDIDFILYGPSSLNLYYQHHLFIKEYIGATSITPEHIEYQYEKYRSDYNQKTDLKEIISRNWSGVQIKKGVLSTPRFIDEIITSVPIRDGINKTIHCQVINGLTSSCFPRCVDVSYQGIIYKLITPFWMYQSFAREGDLLEVCANVNDDKRIILLDSISDFIKYEK